MAKQKAKTKPAAYWYFRPPQHEIDWQEEALKQSWIAGYYLKLQTGEKLPRFKGFKI